MIDISKVRRLSESEIEYIYNNSCLTRHGLKRLTERGATMDQVLNSPLAYVNTDGSINIQNANKPKEYFVFGNKSKHGYPLITYKEQSHNDISLYKKYTLALSGYKRK